MSKPSPSIVMSAQTKVSSQSSVESSTVIVKHSMNPGRSGLKRNLSAQLSPGSTSSVPSLTISPREACSPRNFQARVLTPSGRVK